MNAIEQKTYGPKQTLSDAAKRLREASADPYFDWTFMIVAWAVLFIIFAGVGYLAYNRASQDANAASAQIPAVDSKLFDERKLADVLREFDSRRTERARLIKNGYSGPNDPSL
jgi:hypothetical protein